MLKQLIKFESKILLMHRQTLVHSVLFYLICITIFRFAFGHMQIEANISFGIILTLVLLSIIISSDLIILFDIKDGTISQLFLSGITLQKIIFTKFIFFSVMSSLFAFVALVIGGVLLGVVAINYFVILALVVPVIIQVIILSSIITIKTSSKIMALIIALPFLIAPIIIGILSAVTPAFIMLLIALNFFSLPITLFFSTKLLRRQL